MCDKQSSVNTTPSVLVKICLELVKRHSTKMSVDSRIYYLHLANTWEVSLLNNEGANSFNVFWTLKVFAVGCAKFTIPPY